jgi:hypothetical protein
MIGSTFFNFIGILSINLALVNFTAAQASAVVLKSGASADAKYAEGVLVFTMAKGGLIYEASIGGQKFKFVPFEE